MSLYLDQVIIIVMLVITIRGVMVIRAQLVILLYQDPLYRDQQDVDCLLITLEDLDHHLVAVNQHPVLDHLVAVNQHQVLSHLVAVNQHQVLSHRLALAQQNQVLYHHAVYHLMIMLEEIYQVHVVYYLGLPALHYLGLHHHATKHPAKIITLHQSNLITTATTLQVTLEIREPLVQLTDIYVQYMHLPMRTLVLPMNTKDVQVSQARPAEIF